MTTPHDRYRTRLEAIADGSAIDTLLGDWCDRLGRAPGPDGWRREYGRFHPDRSEWAVLLMEGRPGGDPLVVVELTDGPVEGATPAGPLGWARVTAFPADRALPGLDPVLGRLTEVRIIRYRPGKRCTLTGLDGGERRFVKVLAEPLPHLDTDARALWDAQRAGELSFAVAPPHGWDDATRSVWQGVVPGRPCTDELFGPGGTALTFRLGAALGELARSSVRPTRTETTADQLARTRRAAGRIMARVPALTDRIEAVVATLARRHAAVADRPLVPVHGAPHAHQWLDDGGRLGLIDFDRFALGDPELDVATYLAELDTERALREPVADHEVAMVAGFESTGPTLDPARLELHRLHKRLAKVARTAWALRPDGDRRATKLLTELETSLSAR